MERVSWLMIEECDCSRLREDRLQQTQLWGSCEIEPGSQTVAALLTARPSLC